MSTKQRVGRPSKLTKERKKVLLNQIKLGQPYELACGRAGIHYSNFRRWVKKGEEAQSGEYREFRDDLKEAEGEAAERLLATIRQSGNEGHWQASAWILERRYPQHFGRMSRPEPAEEEKKPEQPQNESAENQGPRDRFLAELQGIRARARAEGNLTLEIRAMEKEMELLGIDADTGRLGDLADTFLSGMQTVVEQAAEDLSE